MPAARVPAARTRHGRAAAATARSAAASGVVRAGRRRINWMRLTDEQLLATRLCDLPLQLRRSPLQRCVRRLYAELDQRGIRFHPHVWFAGEWFSPDGVPGIAVPFYLAHPRLVRLERKMTGEVEGGNPSWMMQILRHEAGHALDSAYRLRRRSHWRTVFGPASQAYRNRYRARPASRHHVQHLGDWYAQSHPTEDFAETFAVWLAPRSGWRRRYAGWPALRKLQLVEQLAAQIGGHVPPVRRRVHIESIREDSSTLAQYYRGRLARARRQRRVLADRLLRRVFAEQPGRRVLAAGALLRAHRTRLQAALMRATGVDRYGVQQVLRTAIERADRLRLYVQGDRRTALRAARLMLARMVRLYMRSNGLRLRV